jgi:hypothetical protein
VKDRAVRARVGEDSAQISRALLAQALHLIVHARPVLSQQSLSLERRFLVAYP